LFIEIILLDDKLLERAQFYIVMSDLKIIGHGNPVSNLESHFMCALRLTTAFPVECSSDGITTV
jgi:hypothetical protein